MNERWVACCTEASGGMMGTHASSQQLLASARRMPLHHHHTSSAWTACASACIAHALQALLDVYMPEAEHLKANVTLRDALHALERDGPFQPTKQAGTVLLSAGNLPEIHWDDVPSAPPPPVAAGAALGVPQPEGFDLLSNFGVAAPAAAVSLQRPAMSSAPRMPALPELNTSIRLPVASQATLAKHALLPSSSYAASPPQHVPQAVQTAAMPQRPLYPDLAELLEPPPPPAQQQPGIDTALAGLDISRQQQAEGLHPPPMQQQQQQQQPFLQPSPYGELQLGPQEVGVISAPRPSQPLPPDATCCQPPPPPSQQQMVPVPPRLQSNGGVSEVKRLQQMRDVHVSVALMDEFMR